MNRKWPAFARLFRKVEYLSVIGNLAPMLGLLGTVIGMILAFRQVASRFDRVYGIPAVPGAVMRYPRTHRHAVNRALLRPRLESPAPPRHG